MPSLADLYNAIDWSSADTALAKWEAMHPTKKGSENASFRYLWRCSLLEGALYGNTEDVVRTARGLLAMAGVWPQIVTYLKAHNLS